MPTKIQNPRLRAFQQQQGRCRYCGVQMWHRDPVELPGIPAKRSSRLRCTAEHLQARCDGGRKKPATWSPPAHIAITPDTRSIHHLRPTPTSRAFVK